MTFYNAPSIVQQNMAKDADELRPFANPPARRRTYQNNKMQGIYLKRSKIVFT